jgi:hypothetical protein
MGSTVARAYAHARALVPGASLFRSPIPSFTSMVLASTVTLGQQVAAITDVFRVRFSPETNFFSDEDELYECFGSHRGGSRFLGRFSLDDVTSLISDSRVGAELRTRGIDDWYVEFDLRDCFVHYCYIRRRSLEDLDQYIGFVIIQLGDFGISPQVKDGPGLRLIRARLPPSPNLLNIRWLSLQNPHAHFSEQRPRLPGQRFPGTGFGRVCAHLLADLARANGRDGIVNVPEHFHNAVLYASEDFHFLNPEDEGRFAKISEDLRPDFEERGMATVSWAVSLGFLLCDGKQFVWAAHEQVLPFSRMMAGYFQSQEYRKIVQATQESCGQFRICWDEAEGCCLLAREQHP